MRCDTIVSLLRSSGGKYNPRTHKHSTKPILIGSLFANMTDLGFENQVQLLGEIKQGSKTIRFKEKVANDRDYLTTDKGDREYRSTSSLNVQKGYTVIAGEDVG